MGGGGGGGGGGGVTRDEVLRPGAVSPSIAWRQAAIDTN